MKLVFSMLTMGTCAMLGSTALAQGTYPEHPVTIVVPFAAGGPVDFVARELGMVLSKETGQSYVVQNLGGGQGVPAMNRVGTAKPDGYTIFLAGASNVTDQPLKNKTSREAALKLEPVSLVAMSPQVLVVTAGLPITSVKELVDYAKDNPGKVNFGSAGVGTISHLGIELFASEADVDVVHVPYKGTSQVAPDLRSGTVDALLTSMPSIKPLIDSGAIRAVGLTSDSVGKDTEGIAKISETIPGVEYATWYGMYATKGTPPEIIDTISQQLKKALADPDLVEKMKASGIKIVSSTPAELQDLVERDSHRWTKAVSNSSIKQVEK